MSGGRPSAPGADSGQVGMPFSRPAEPGGAFSVDIHRRSRGYDRRILRLITLGAAHRRRAGLSRRISRSTVCRHNRSQAVLSSGRKAPRGAMDWRAIRSAATKLALDRGHAI